MYTRYRSGVLDEGVVGVMAEYYGVDRQTEAEKLLAWDYGSHTVTYFLLLARYIHTCQVHTYQLARYIPTNLPGTHLLARYTPTFQVHTY